MNVVLADKKLEKRLNKLKPKIMLFDTSIENKDSVMVNNILVKIINPVFLSDLLGPTHESEYLDNNYIPVYSNNVQKFTS